MSLSVQQQPWLPAGVVAGLDDLKRRLKAELGDELVEVRLFGSFARGEQHDESDVDVLVLFEREPDPADWDRLFDHVAAVNVAHRV